MSGCVDVTDAGVMVLANTLKYLEAIDLSRCTLVTDKGLIHLFRNHGKMMQQCDISYCVKVRLEHYFNIF